MKVKRRIFSGTVCEQIVFLAPERLRDLKNARPARPRFKTTEEREAHRLGISRRKHARIVNANFGPGSLYGTLTLDDENEVHTFQEARRLRDNYYKRLLYHYPDARVMLYMGRGKHTRRIHFHILTDGIPAEAVVRLWGMGDVRRVEPLREHNYYNGIDCGQDYTGLANYLFDHWTEEQGGHRWKGSRKTLSKPDYEAPTEARRAYAADKPPRPPKDYMLVEVKETAYGYLYFKYVRIPDRRRPRRRPAAG